jgi:hypothetical protein
MSEVLFELVSASNFAEHSLGSFHRKSHSVVGWESSEYAVTPI